MKKNNNYISGKITRVSNGIIYNIHVLPNLYYYIFAHHFNNVIQSRNSAFKDNMTTTTR